MNVRELVDCLPPEANPEIVILDLDTGYLVPIDTVQLETHGGLTQMVIRPVQYHDNRFPWDDSKERRVWL